MTAIDRALMDARHALADVDRRLTEAAHAIQDGQDAHYAMWDALNYCEVAGAHMRVALALQDAQRRMTLRGADQ